MSEVFKIILTSSLTIIGGVIVFLLSEIINKFIISPIHEQKKIIGEIADSLIYYANIYTSQVGAKQEQLIEASEALRQLATLLRSKTQLIPSYSVFVAMHVVLPIDNINTASRELIGLSNAIFQKQDHLANLTSEDRADRIADALNIEIG